MRHTSLSGRLTRKLLIICSLIFIIALIVMYILSGATVAEETIGAVQNELHAETTIIDKSLQNTEIVILSADYIIKENINNEKKLYHLTKEIVANNPVLVGCAIAFAEGQYRGKYAFAPYSFRKEDGDEVKSINLAKDSASYLSEEWFVTTTQLRRPYWSEPYFDKNGSEQQVVTFCMPIFDGDSNVLAVITADMAVKWLEDKLYSIQHESVVTLTSQSGKCFASSSPDFAGADITEQSIVDACIDLKQLEEVKRAGKGIVNLKINDTYVFSAVETLRNGWKISHMCEYKQIEERTVTMRIVIAVACLLCLLVSFVLCRKMIKSITKPLSELSETALQMAAGDFGTELPVVQSQDEILRLRDAFAAMQNYIVYYLNEIREKTGLKERMEAELNVGRSIQLGMLSTDFPKNDVVELHATLAPAKEVGGDYYDFAIINNHLLFAIGDVSGKGVPAALLMAIARSSMRLFDNPDQGTAILMEQLNNVINDNNPSQMFITVFLGCLDLATGRLSYCNAGHNPIVVKPANKEPYYLKAKSNIVVGVIDNFSYAEEEVMLEHGSQLLLYTDGVSEAERGDKEQYGEDRLLQWASQNLENGSSQQNVEKLYNDVKLFVNGNDPNDDITIMNIQYK